MVGFVSNNMEFSFKPASICSIEGELWVIVCFCYFFVHGFVLECYLEFLVLIFSLGGVPFCGLSWWVGCLSKWVKCGGSVDLVKVLRV